MAEKKKSTANLKYQRDRDRQKVKGIFKFHEIQGGSMTFVYKAYKGDEVQKYTLEDGKVYEIPLGCARHLNNNCWYPVHKDEIDDDGKPVARIAEKVHRCSFHPIGFMDIEDMAQEADIVEASPLV